MVWSVRSREKRNPVRYGPNSSLYTIRIVHSGELKRAVGVGVSEYLGGSVDYIDNVDPDEISLIEVHNMAKEVGCELPFHVYVSNTKPTKSDSLLPLKDDSNTLSMFSHEKGRIIGLYVDHSGKDFAEVKLVPNLCFNSRDDVINAIKKHAVDWKKDTHFPLRQVLKIQAKCKQESCPWSIYVSRSPQDATWVVKSIGDEHDCPTAEKVSVATPAWLETIYGEEIRMNPTCPMDDLKLKIERKHGIQFSDWQIYRLRDLAFSKFDVGKQYTMLYRYGEEIIRSNPGSTVKIKPRSYANKKLFERFYICYGATKAGFTSGCRKVLLFDGCHIRTGYGGILLTVVGLDPNNGMYPVAYGVVEKERKES